jgi:hypothetical protein
MDTNFYCEDCETPIEADDVEKHEDEGHTVRGTIRPNRLLSQDPWERSDTTDGGNDVSGDSG